MFVEGAADKYKQDIVHSSFPLGFFEQLSGLASIFIGLTNRICVSRIDRESCGS